VKFTPDPITGEIPAHPEAPARLFWGALIGLAMLAVAVFWPLLRVPAGD
jgi:hypothetical protein